MGAIDYLLRKLGMLLISLFFIVTLTFILMHSIPGDPLTGDQAIPEEVMKALYHYYGLDQPLPVQYVHYLKKILSWELGPSFKFEGRTVNEIINISFPVSFFLGLFSLVLALFGGILLGMISGWYRRKWQDHLATIASVIGISVPSFLVATLLQYFFCIKLHLLPVARLTSMAHAILPALSLAALPMTFIAKLTRSSMIEVLGQDYITTAKSKGLSSAKIILSHVLRNMLLPVVTYIGPLSASILTGSFVVEKIFAIPGLGYWFVMSVANRDYTVILGLTVFYSCLLMLLVFFVDIAYMLIDPRIRIRKVR